MEMTEPGLLNAARERLTSLLPGHFELTDAMIDGQAGAPDSGDALWQLKEQRSGYTLILVEAKTSFAPRDVEKIEQRT
ncbi:MULTISPECIES: hypothetical protein [unclassified Micromonospora]|uniref:hypothetical protein n=1 Tax=unclassified Micromonospora TaxID=2617518 RepID=UPI003626E81D